MPSPDEKLVYLDSSALVKLVIEEPESAALVAYLEGRGAHVTSRLSLVEVPRAVAIGSSRVEAARDAHRLLARSLLVDVSDALLRSAAALSSRALRTLDAIHLASAIKVAPDEVITYDRRLLRAAAEHGLAVASPGA